ncbi:MAG: valine--pyruvate transaminase, partial [Gammaproteobacteria bacterium]|nr:valine--pyruvate transaminase [Gammaproteobacteria bacterium]
FKERLDGILEDKETRHSLLGIYQSPQGDSELLEYVAALLNKQYGWNISAKNVAVSNGSQAAFFVLFNLFAGLQSDGSRKRIQLPLAPEYLGYSDSGLSEPFFTATKPTIELLDQKQFKYHVDFAELEVNTDSAALCVSRPTNPTGNVLTDDEIQHLDALARAQDIPLIIDGAYGTPFPNILFEQATPHWNDNTIVVLSLSKLGLPGARTGFVIAREEIIDAYTRANTILNLACGNLGTTLGKSLFADGEILRASQNIVKPYYQDKVEHALRCAEQSLADLPYRIHKPEGAIFLWLWFEGLPISSQTLYQRLKEKGLLVVPGEPFFVGLNEPWQHKNECLRLSYAQPAEVVKQGFELVAAEVKAAFA